MLWHAAKHAKRRGPSTCLATRHGRTRKSCAQPSQVATSARFASAERTAPAPEDRRSARDSSALGRSPPALPCPRLRRWPPATAVLRVCSTVQGPEAHATKEDSVHLGGAQSDLRAEGRERIVRPTDVPEQLRVDRPVRLHRRTQQRIQGVTCALPIQGRPKRSQRKGPPPRVGGAVGVPGAPPVSKGEGLRHSSRQKPWACCRVLRPQSTEAATLRGSCAQSRPMPEPACAGSQAPRTEQAARRHLR